MQDMKEFESQILLQLFLRFKLKRQLSLLTAQGIWCEDMYICKTNKLMAVLMVRHNNRT